MVRAADKSKKRRKGRPPDSDGEKTRQRILDAAQQCFAELGYRSASNREIAEMADVTPGSIYHYFENKRELFLTVHRQMQNRILERAKQSITNSKTFADAAHDLMYELLMLALEDPSMRKFTSVVRTEALRNPEVSGVLHEDQEWRDIYRKLAALAVKTGEIPKSKERGLRTILAMSVLGTTQHGLEASVEDQKLCVRSMVELLSGDFIRPPSSDT